MCRYQTIAINRIFPKGGCPKSLSSNHVLHLFRYLNPWGDQIWWEALRWYKREKHHLSDVCGSGISVEDIIFWPEIDIEIRKLNQTLGKMSGCEGSGVKRKHWNVKPLTFHHCVNKTIQLKRCEIQFQQHCWLLLSQIEWDRENKSEIHITSRNWSCYVVSYLNRHFSSTISLAYSNSFSEHVVMRQYPFHMTHRSYSEPHHDSGKRKEREIFSSVYIFHRWKCKCFTCFCIINSLF